VTGRRSGRWCCDGSLTARWSAEGECHVAQRSGGGFSGGCAGLRWVQWRRDEEGGELLRVVSEAVAWQARRAGVAAVTRGAGSGGKLAWSEQRRLGVLSR
jgi:hypothetical protein